MNLLITMPLILLLLLGVPWLVSSPYFLDIVILMLMYMLLGMSWNLLGGFAGQISLGHAIFFGLGAYCYGFLINQHLTSVWIALASGALAATVASIPIGILCFRLRGPYFVLVTLAAAEVVRILAVNLVDLTQGAEGMVITPAFGISKTPYYYLALAFVLLELITMVVLCSSRFGYYYMAVREDEDTALAIGVNPLIHKLWAFGISAFFAGLTGAFYASYRHVIDPSVVLSLERSVDILLGPLVGGIGTLAGPLVGAVIMVSVNEGLRSLLGGAYLVAYGLILVVIVLFFPSGVLGVTQRFFTREAGGEAGKADEAA
ncbi:MAG: branched-chain amino acid ABC transporter permease [Candidatus Tectomicrobia bacterium]|nr:branched-chain amino acid ABC transporter permease [Candidatus Tectomicrobia bacterium]